jgi:methylglutaconyl-CoA hydratase
MTELVLYDLRERAAVLTLHRPQRRNALSRELIAALDAALARAAEDSAVRSVILTGAGPVFCAGMDLAELQESLGADPGASPIWDDALRLARLYDRIYRHPLPVIAAVNGSALAGGAGLVSVCDLAVAVPEARFGYPEVRRGLVAAMVMPHLLRLVGERTARYLLLTGETLSADEALRTGFLNQVAPAEQLLDVALDWARSLAEGGPLALTRTKELLGAFSHQAVGLEESAKASAAPRLGEECRRGLEAFFTKNPPPWA